jgi:hypothetical protein
MSAIRRYRCDGGCDAAVGRRQSLRMSGSAGSIRSERRTASYSPWLE